MEIRTATIADLDAITKIENECFPPEEAAPKEALADRLAHYPDHFWLLFDEDNMVGFVNGMVSNYVDLRDEMYQEAAKHQSKGSWQMIFGVDTLPAYRNQGCAAMLLERAIEDAKTQDRLGLVLTCKDQLIPYYAKFGFNDEGISDSKHGGARWHQMRLTFAK